MRKNRNKFYITAAFLVLVVLLFVASEVSAGPATDQLKGTLEQIIKVLNDPSLKSPEKVGTRRDLLLKLIKGRFQEEEFSKRVLGSYWKERTEEEKKEFIKIFIELLARTYFDKIDMYLAKAKNLSNNNIHYLNETVKGDYAVVATKVIISQDNELPVYYRLINNNNNWLVCDIAIEGVSLVKNYRAQFTEMLADSSFKDVIAKLEAKLKTGNAAIKK